MHPGPMNEGIEIAADVAAGGQSVITNQVANGVAVRMAILYLLACPVGDYLPPGALTIAVEAKLTLEVGSTVVLPAAMRYQTELAQNIAALKAAGNPSIAGIYIPR